MSKSTIAQNPYLKKYLSGDDDKKAKKRKKKSANAGLLIQEDSAFANVEVGAASTARRGGSFGSDEDEDSNPEDALLEQKSKKTTGFIADSFQTVQAPSSTPIKEEPIDEEDMPVRRRHDSAEDSSPPRRRHDSDQDLSPPRRKRRDSDSSPPRTRRRDSPDHKRRHDSGRDLSPARRKRRDSDSSPPRARRRRHDSDDDASPPRRRKIASKDASPPRRKRRDSDSSPPRARQRDLPDRDSSPPRRRRADRDSSPPIVRDSPQHKRRRHDSTENLPPPRRRHDSDQDLPPPRRERNDSVSPPPKSRRQDSPPEPKEKQMTSYPRPGKRLTKDQQARNDRESRKQAELDAKYAAISKGVAQEEQRQEKIKEMEQTVQESFTRYADDVAMNKRLKSQLLGEDDPMNEYMSKKNMKIRMQSEHVYPTYTGQFPPNRYSIPPGYRWDGVDRSNGFESKLSLRSNRQMAEDSATYRAIVELAE